MNRNLVAASVVGIASVATTLVAAGPTLASGNTKTLKFVSVEILSHGIDSTHFIGADKIKQNGKLVGTDSTSCVAASNGQSFKCDVAAAFKGGELYGTFTDKANGDLTGTVTGGTRHFAGATGTISGTAASKTSENVTVTYHT